MKQLLSACDLKATVDLKILIVNFKIFCSSFSQTTDMSQPAALDPEKQNQYETLSQATVYQSHGERNSQELSRSPDHGAHNNNLTFTKKTNWPPLTEAATS